MHPLEFQRELAAFDEKIALAELEETKAAERVKELRFQKARFALDVSNAICQQTLKSAGGAGKDPNGPGVPAAASPPPQGLHNDSHTGSQ